jgi:hypothetical protein
MAVAVGAMAVVAGAMAVVAATLVVVTSEVAEDILVLRISAALAWVCLGSVPLTSVAVIFVVSATCRGATSLTLTPRIFTD